MNVDDLSRLLAWREARASVALDGETQCDAAKAGLEHEAIPAWLKCYGDYLVAKIMQRVDVRPNGCWLWKGCLSGKYAKIGVARRNFRVHRVLWESLNGPVPPGRILCHTCDTPTCVNPEHVYPGTKSDNARDAVQRQRMNCGSRNGTRTRPERRSRGEAHYNAKITEDDVRRIRAKREEGFGLAAIARELDLPHGSVRGVLEGKSWTHVV